MTVNVVKYTLLSLAALLVFVGTLVTAADNAGSPTAPISQKDKDYSPESRHSLIPEGKLPTFDGKKILASLRFWEKDKTPQHTPHKPPAATGNVPARPQEVPTAQNSVPASQGQAQMPQYMVEAGRAPEPPPSSYTVQENIGQGDAPHPTAQSGTLAYNSNEVNAPTPQDVRPAKSHSYSFDTRDWVESFPSQQERVGNTPAVTQPITPMAELPSQVRNPNEDDQWNGQATMLVAHVQRAPVPSVVTPAPVATFSPTALAVPKPVENPLNALPAATKPLINLSPSYEKRLPHVQTCGVVVVQANFPLTEIASILDEIEQLQHDLNHYIGVPAPKEKIELCLFKNEETYYDFLREVFPKAPRDRRALYVKLDDKPGTLMVQKSKDFEIDLRHEMTHAIIHASIPRVPIWLDEGLAKYFEVPIRDRAKNHPYLTTVRYNAKLGAVPSLDRLAKLETIDDMGAKEYRDSWAWTHFLIHRSPETHRLLAAYLQMLSTWTGVDEGNVKSGNVMTLPGGKTVDLGIAWGREKQPPVPSLKAYLDDILDNQRDTFKTHFGSTEK